MTRISQIVVEENLRSLHHMSLIPLIGRVWRSTRSRRLDRQHKPSDSARRNARLIAAYLYDLDEASFRHAQSICLQADAIY